ncbi:MAG: hypothetical protein JO104_02425 [Candidatus Eremiobacteraeota bacterium]|nr:hypothetical protein [Candidatus Eremiobacteraeota bacterium]
MAGPLQSEEIARAAAEGVAIALSARDATFRGPIHIICGIPVDGELFEVTIGGEAGALRSTEMKKRESR